MTNVPSENKFPGNSYKAKKATSPEEPDKKIEKVISGNVTQRRKPLGRKLAETFGGDDARSVGVFIVTEVFVPAIKSLISDAVSQGIERLLFGGSVGPRRTGVGSGRSYTPYNRMSSNGTSTAGSSNREISNRARATHNFDEIVMDTRSEAEAVLEGLGNVIEEYGTASVQDLYDLVGITGKFTDAQWGWNSIKGANIRRIREGYLLELPPTSSVE